MLLSDLNNNDNAIIIKVKGRGEFRKRITEMGFIKGQKVTVIKDAPLKDPVEYTVMGYNVSLRRSEAELIEVSEQIDNIILQDIKINSFTDFEPEKNTAIEKIKTINVALVGNPNCGKTTLFNFASGAKEHTGNYSGVTVDAKKGKFNQDGYIFNITDLPGTYSLSAYSPEELYVRKHIVTELPDVIINVIDSSNLERNLYLTSCLIDMDVKVVIALNMHDELLKKGDKLNCDLLGKLLGIPIVPTTASNGKAIKELFNKVIDVYEDKEPIVRHIHINYGKEVEESLKEIQKVLKTKQNEKITLKVAPRFLALNLLENDKETISRISGLETADEILKISQKEIKKLELQIGEDTETYITDSRYGFVSGALKETLKPGIIQKRKATEAIDNFMTHKVFGFPIFIFFMWLMFQATFTIGSYPMSWIEHGVAFLSEKLNILMTEGMFKDLIINGIINGVGGVIIFLPNILLLFFFISLMEDTGYMARAAFIMDKLMHKIGLHGKSFIPLIMGFGCNVPAIMSTRTIENRNDRLLTMLINPFMSCSARLPVYIIIIGAVFPAYAGTVLFLIYGVGILLAILVAKLFKKLLFKSKDAPFVMELPPYRKPILKTSLKHMWRKGSQYLHKMGGVILVASIIIWTLGYFPRESKNTKEFLRKIETAEQQLNKQLSNINDKNLKEEIFKKAESNIMQLKLDKESDRQENSYIGKIGLLIEPVIEPLGFDSKIGISLVTGIAAKEIVVSTMGVLYGADFGADEKSISLKEKLKSEVYKKGKHKGEKIFTPLTAISFMLFILIYFPCFAVIAAIRKETGTWKWAAFTVAYTTLLAWIVAFAVFQIGSIII